jgi:hypothetical protein
MKGIQFSDWYQASEKHWPVCTESYNVTSAYARIHIGCISTCIEGKTPINFSSIGHNNLCERRAWY